MSELIYAIKVASVSSSGLEIMYVKIGRTTNLEATVRQYRRSNPEGELLNLWLPNPELSLPECEKGVHRIADEYAFKREGERFIFLQQSFEDFSETINLILRSVDRRDTERPVSRPRLIARRTERPSRRALSQDKYRLPILEALITMGGRGKVGEVIRFVYQGIKSELGPGDLQSTASSKEPRWRNRLRWERKNMVDDGLLAPDSRRGVWEITHKGREYYNQHRNK